MRIIHIITGLEAGGAEMTLYKLLSQIDKQVFSPIVISLMEGGAIRNRIEELGIPVYSLEMRRGVPSLSAALYMRRLVNELQPDIVQGWMYHGNLAALAAAVMYKGIKPTVYWNIRQSLYDLSDEKRLTRLIIRLGAKVSKYVAKIVYNANVSEAQHVALGYDKTKSFVIPNGFDLELFKPDASARIDVRFELNIPDGDLLVGLIGRYHPMKDHDNFLKAAALLVAKHQNIKFLLVGKDVDVENEGLQEMIKVNGLQDKVILLGERSDIPRLTAALDIAVLSSFSEAFPNVVGEAMASSVPCVVTEVGDAAWVVGDTGKVVASRQPQALAESLMILISLSEEERMQLGKASRQRIKENFSLGDVVKQYECLYKQGF